MFVYHEKNNGEHNYGKISTDYNIVKCNKVNYRCIYHCCSIATVFVVLIDTSLSLTGLSVCVCVCVCVRVISR